LDEQRAPFEPSVWKLDPSNKRTELVQVWFAGAHTNVGGGSSTKDENGKTGMYEQLSYIAYVWMLDRVRPYLALDPDELQAQQEDILSIIQCAPHALAQKDEPVTKGWIQSGLDFLRGKASGARDAVYSYAGGKIMDSFTLPYDLLGSREPREPCALTSEEVAKGIRTGEAVHPSVWYRQESQRRVGKVKEEDIYQPIAMKGWEREADAGQEVRWIKKDAAGNVVKMMPEFEIGKMAKEKSLERWLIDQSWCDSVHERVHGEWKSS